MKRKTRSQPESDNTILGIPLNYDAKAIMADSFLPPAKPAKTRKTAKQKKALRQFFGLESHPARKAAAKIDRVEQRVMLTQKGKRTTYAIHDVFSDKQGNVLGWSDAVSEAYDTPQAMVDQLNSWIAEAQRAQVFPEDVLKYRDNR